MLTASCTRLVSNCRAARVHGRAGADASSIARTRLPARSSITRAMIPPHFVNYRLRRPQERINSGAQLLVQTPQRWRRAYRKNTELLFIAATVRFVAHTMLSRVPIITNGHKQLNRSFPCHCSIPPASSVLSFSRGSCRKRHRRGSDPALSRRTQSRQNNTAEIQRQAAIHRVTLSRAAPPCQAARSAAPPAAEPCAAEAHRHQSRSACIPAHWTKREHSHP